MFFSCHAHHRNLHSFLHDALPILSIREAPRRKDLFRRGGRTTIRRHRTHWRPSNWRLLIPFPIDWHFADSREPDWLPESAKRSEEHTSELQSRRDLVCRLLLEKKK